MVQHLPIAIKRLLTSRNSEAWPSPPRSTLERLLAKTRNDARARRAETGWLVLATCTLLTMNRPSAVGHLYSFATRSGDTGYEALTPEKANKAALMRESALKSAVFVGVPRAILSLAALTEALEDDVKSSLRTESLRVITADTIQSTIGRGRSLWDSIYQPHADKLHDKLGSYHPDLISFIIQSYGSVLAPLPGGNDVQGNLGRALTSVVGTACLRAEGHVGPQLTSHVFGLLKARNVQNQGAEDAWLSSDEGAEWVIRTVDTIVEDVTGKELVSGEVIA